MTDMNKIKGGTEEQRKILRQERQRRRERKNKFRTTTSAPSTPKPKNTSSAITKTNVPAPKGGALKTEPKSSPK